jgi:hypothetical protein
LRFCSHGNKRPLGVDYYLLIDARPMSAPNSANSGRPAVATALFPRGPRVVERSANCRLS